MSSRVAIDTARLEVAFDEANEALSTHEKDDDNKSGLPATWFGFLWQNDPVLLALSGVAQLLWSSFIILGAYYFVNEMNRNRDKTRGLELCFLYLGTIVVIVLAYQFKELWVGRMGANIKKVLSARVAEHALLHGSVNAGDRSLALVLASQDSHNICVGAKNVWQLPAAISEGIVITALVIFTTSREYGTDVGGLTGGITAGILIGGFVFLFGMSWKMNHLKHDVSQIQDKQASLFSEVLANIRSFRYYGWDAYFLKRLHEMTDALIPSQGKLVVMKALNSCLVIAFPVIPATVLFVSSYYRTGKGPTIAFQGLVLSLLNTFRYPLWNLPSSLQAVSSANNSYQRLRIFLGKFGPKDSRTKSDERGAVHIEKLPVGAEGSVLEELHISPGSLVILQGPVKSYKSTILRTLAGHHPVPDGATVTIGGSVSYAPQQPWMCQSSIQDNIVSFEQPIDLQRYQAVVHACALTQDLATMPLGDQTPVAEKGISLSGGQRQRVALARAAYRRADVYLLDNPLSAVDDATQEFIWENLFEGLLSDATVIVASSRAVRSCSSIVHLSPKGIVGETVSVAGWTETTAPARPLPSRYCRQIPPVADVGGTSPPELDNTRRRRTSLVEMARQDVSAEARLFERYSEAKVPATLPSVLADMQDNLLQETEMLESGKSARKNESFLDLIERNQEEQGVVSVRKMIGSRRLSYADSGISAHAPPTEEPSLATIVPIAVKDKHPFLIWIAFTGMGKVSLAVMVFLYWFYPAPRLFIEQWIGFWAAKTYSADDQFNMNILALCFVGVMITRIVLDLGAFHYGAAAERNMRKIFCSTVINAPMTFFMTENLGPIISVFSRDLSIVGDELAQDFHAGIYYIIFNFAVSVFVCVRFPPFVAVVIVIYSSLIFLQFVYSKKIVLIRQEFQQAQDDVFRDLYDSLEGIEILRSAHAEEWAIKQLAESLQKNAIAIVAVEKTNVWLARRADFLAICLCFATVLFVNYFDAPISARSLMISGSMPILVLFNWSMKLLGNVQFLLNSVHRIKQYVDQVQSEDKGGSGLPKDFPSSGEIKFKDLCLRYRPSLPLALDKVSFDLNHGAKVGVVGRTGSGKSTLLVALFRLIQPCGGSLIIDGQSASSVAVDGLRRSLAIIPQDPAMFQGTLRDNLDPYGEYSDQQVRQVLFQVGLCETRDMQSSVQVSGEDWSLGERQLVCLARVLLKRPKILFMDEATASLDAKTEALFQKVLEENFADATILCIAHRTDTLRWCRTRITMQQGKVLAIAGNTAPEQ